MENLDLILILSTALIASMGHCIGMCGGIVVAYTSSKIDSKTSQLRQSISHLLYNLGRVVTYSILGAIFGYIGQVIAFDNSTKGILFFITGTLMLLAGLSLLGKIKFLNSAELSIAKYSWYTKSFQYLMRSKSYGSFFLLGLLNGIIPCGLVYSFAIFAASTASVFYGAIVMAIFGLATIPALFFFGMITKVLQRGSIRDLMMNIAAILVIVYGIFTLYKGYNFISNPDFMKNHITKDGQMKCSPGKCG